jgi:dipeptide transport system substrate-binding protein
MTLRHALRVTLALALAPMAVLAATPLPAQAGPKTLIYCSEGAPEGFNPVFYNSGNTFDATSRNVFDKLVRFERGTTDLKPGLAERWEISEDGRVYVFHLRPGVTFHANDRFTPSRTLTADDVVWSFERQGKADHPYHAIGPGAYVYFQASGFADNLDSVEKLDDLTVAFHLKEPQAPFLANMATDFAVIFSAEYAEAMLKAGTPEIVDRQPIGTGPFAFHSYQTDSRILYRAHETYWRGRTPLDRLVFVITPDATVRQEKLKSGECHVMPFPVPADLPALKANPALKVPEREGMNVGYLAFNQTKPPFGDRRVREALALAIDREAILEAVFDGQAVLANGPIPPSLWSHAADLPPIPFDPDRARALLEEAGMASLKTTIWAMPVQRPYNPNARRMAEIIQANWKAVGVDAEIVSYEWGEYLKRAAAGEHDSVLLGWTGDNGDPDNFLAVLLGCDGVGGSNRAQWCHQPFEDLIQKAKVVSSMEARTALYEEAQVIFKEQAPWATIAHSVVYQPVRAEVLDWKIDPLGGNIFYGVDLKE